MEGPDQQDASDRDQDEPADALPGQPRLEDFRDAGGDQHERPVPDDVASGQETEAVEHVDDSEPDQDGAGNEPHAAPVDRRAVHDPPPGPVTEGGVRSALSL